MQIKLNEKSDNQFDKFKSKILTDLAKEPIGMASREQVRCSITYSVVANKLNASHALSALTTH